MVRLAWNFEGWIYQDGVRNLRDTFASAGAGIDAALRSAYGAVDKYDAAIAAGAEAQIERDDEGGVIHDPRDILIYHTETAEQTKEALNKALAITMFHHWERSARGWTGRANGKFTTLVEDVVAKGYPISPDLECLHLLVNLLKHANARHGVALQERRPDYFRRRFDPAGRRIEWYEEVQLTDAHIAELFDILAVSGPDDKTGI